MTQNTHSPIGVQPTAIAFKSYFALFAMLYGTLLVAAYPALGLATLVAVATAVATYRRIR